MLAALGTLAPAAAAAGAAPPRAVEIRLPTNAAADPQALLDKVSCLRAGACAAGGSFVDTSQDAQAIVVTQTAGRWNRAIELRMPSNAATNPNAETNGISCTRPGSCVAVGDYFDGGSMSQGFLATESGGSWRRARLVAPPPNTASSTNFSLNAVS